MGPGFFILLLLATAALALLLLLVGAVTPAGPRRGFSDWVMIGGMGISFLALIALIVVGYLGAPLESSELGERIAMAIAFAVPGGGVVFGAGFLLSRFESRRQAAQLELLTQRVTLSQRPASPATPPSPPGTPPASTPPR